MRILFNKTDDDTGGTEEITETQEGNSFNASVTKAEAELEKSFSGEGEGNEDEDLNDDKDSNDGTEDDGEDEGEGKDDDQVKGELNEEQLTHAKTLFKLLNDPKTARQALESLVRSAGLDIKEPETKEEAKKAKKTVKEIVQERLGEKYKFLSGELGDVLQELFDSVVDEKTNDIREEQTKQTKERMKEQVSRAQDKVLDTYVDVPVTVLQEVLRIQTEGELLPGPKANNESYFRGCLNMAAENLGVTLVKKSKSSSKSRDQNGKGRSPLTKISGRHGVQEARKSTQVKSFGDAVNMAAEEIEAASQK